MYYREGLLTKTPSAGLAAVAALAGSVERPASQQYTAGLADFFTVGVQQPQVDRVMTPSRSRSAKPQDDKWKVSNKSKSLGVLGYI